MKPESRKTVPADGARPIHDSCFLIHDSRRGFSLLEVMIVLGIVTSISALILVSFPAVSQSINLQRSSRAMALALRKAQNMAFAVRPIEVAPGARRTPFSFGVHWNRATMPDTYVIFADFFPSGSPNGRYDGGAGSTDMIVETVRLEPGIAFGNITCMLGGTDQCGDVLNIVFSVPDAQTQIGNASQTVGESAELVLTGRGGLIARKITVRTTGQIQVEWIQGESPSPPPVPPPPPPASCVNVISSCSGFSGSAACTARGGCSWADPECSGNEVRCRDITSQGACITQVGCSWNGTTCGGSHDDCDAYSQAVCPSQLNCSWTGGCAGTAVSCNTFTTQSACLAQSGCAWQ